MKRRGLPGLVTVCLALHAGWAADYTMGRYDPARTGSTAEKLSPPLALSWKFATEKDNGLTANPLCVGSRIYFCAKGSVYCLDAESGSLFWQYEIRFDIRATPLYADGKLFVFTAKGEIHVLDPTDDTKPTVVQVLDLAKGRSAAITADPVLVGKDMYLLSDYGRLFKVDVKTLQSTDLGNVRQNAGAKSVLTCDHGVLYFTDSDNMLTSYDLASKRAQWAYSQGRSATAPTVFDSSPLLSSYEGCKKIRWRSGGKDWTRAGVGGSHGMPAVSGGQVVVPSNDEYIYALDGRSGAVKARYETDSLVDLPVTIADQDIFYGTVVGNIGCLDAKTLERKWLYRLNPIDTIGGKDTPHFAVATPPIVSNGNLLVVTREGTLYCFRADAVDVGKPRIYLPQITTNAVDNSAVSLPVYDDEWRADVLADAKRNAKPGEEVKPPTDAQMLKLPGKQKIFRFETFMYDEGSGIDFSKIHVTFDGKPYEDKLMTVSHNDYLLTIDLISKQPKEGLTRERLSDGDHVLALSIPDYKGNVLDRKYSFTIDNSLPPIEPPRKAPPLTPGMPPGAGPPGAPPGAPPVP